MHKSEERLAAGEKAALARVRKAIAELEAVDVDSVEENGIADLLDVRRAEALAALRECEAAFFVGEED